MKHESLGNSNSSGQKAGTLEEMGSVDQLEYLLSNLYAASHWSSNAVDFDAFDQVTAGEEFSPFLKIVAKIGKSFKRGDENFGEYSGYEMLAPDVEKPDADSSAKQFMDRQKEIHEEFPVLPDFLSLEIGGVLRKIAPDAAAVVKPRSEYIGPDMLYYIGNSIDSIASSDGKVYSVTDKNNPFDLTDESIACLVAILNNQPIQKEIERMLNLSLDEIPLKAQAHLLKFMSGANNSRFNNLCDVLGSMKSKNLRQKLLENFVAVDFGEDFGDSLLTIVESERLSDKEKEKIFDTISSCRESIDKITELYAEFDDGKFAHEYARAANERLTDATMVFSQIAEKGSASADLDWAGKPEFDFDSAMEALNYEADSLAIISGTLEDVSVGKKGSFAEIVMHPDPSSQRLRRTVYNFYSPEHGYVLLYTRPEGSHSFDPMVEYGKMRSRYDTESTNTGVEASISLIVNPIDPFALPSPYRPDYRATKNPRFYDAPKMDKVSAIRLDREGRAPGMAADDPDRDPISPVGMISVDLAAIGDRADTPSGKIARLLSVGGKLREEASNVEFALNHNTKWFSQEEYGTTEGFRRLVDFVDTTAEKWCIEHKPRRDDESFERLMRQARGRKVRKVA